MNGQILIVDDSLTIRMHLAEILEAAGFRTVACATGAEAREQFAKTAFALVILDILLPDADGVDLLAEIRANSASSGAAIMLLTTEAEVGDRIRGLKTGADEYIGKPYEPSYVVSRARELMAPKTEGRASERTSVLIIDDSVTFREELKGALETAGYQVLVAESGEEGLRIASDMRPAAIIVDGMLPGADGATVIRRIRLDAALRHLPCLLLTGSEDQRAELHALDAGADAFVRKEEDLGIIMARLHAMLRSAGGRDGDRRPASLMAPKKILTVDDSETFLQELAGALREDGYDVVLARSGEEALDVLAVQAVDCILLDLLMPGIGGQETCRRVKALPALRDIPIVMLTAVEDRDAMILGFGAGADDYIAKSSDFAVLRARVLAQIRRKQFEDETRIIREQLLQRELEAADARAAKAVAEARAVLIDELELKNEELEAFSYSVAHDLRAPLRRIDGFSAALMEDHAEQLDDAGKAYLARVRDSAQRMGQLIDDLLRLSRITRGTFDRGPVDLATIARQVDTRLRSAHPERHVDFIAPERIAATGDANLLTVVLENLLGNAWKFTGKRERGRIELFVTDQNGHAVYGVRDNGAGFDMAHASKMFGVFQRLHSPDDFEGTGVGLATVQRVIRRHGGRIWAEGEVGTGATFLFRLDSEPPASDH